MNILGISGAITIIGLSVGCTTVKENGKTVFLTGANAGHLVYRSPAGSFLEIDKLDHAIVHRTIFDGVGKDIMAGASTMIIP